MTELSDGEIAGIIIGSIVLTSMMCVCMLWCSCLMWLDGRGGGGRLNEWCNQCCCCLPNPNPPNLPKPKIPELSPGETLV